MDSIARRLGSLVSALLGIAMLAGCTPSAKPQEKPSAAPSAFPMDYVMYREAVWELRLVAIVLIEGGVRLEVDYRNVTGTAQPLECTDATGGSYIRFEAQTIPMSDGYCAARTGQPISVEPGGTLHSWGFFPTARRSGQKFAVSWWDWGVTPMEIQMP